MNLIKEGGNVFKNNDKQALTQRINQADVAITVDWLEQLTDLDLRGEIDPDTGYPERWLGSSGKKPTSGDLDLAVNANEITQQQLVAELTQWCNSHKLDPKEYVKNAGGQVHFKTPIGGNPNKGYVQTDFMFMKDMGVGQFFLQASPNSKFSGQDRAVVVNSLAKAFGYKLDMRRGIINRANEEVVETDPDKIAKLLLTPGATKKDLTSVENIVQALKNDPKKDEKLADARSHFERVGTPFFENTSTELYTEVHFLARLRDRIVNQGMEKLIENIEVQGGKAKGIEHIEDLVFRKGTAGIKEALAVIEHLKDNTKSSVTVKWDGKPAVVFGREPNGTFVLTDVAGFGAVGYNGMFTSSKQITQHLANRDTEAKAQGKSANRVAQLAPIYQTLWPMLEAATPKDFKGYIQGDLLYITTPPEVSGAFVFKPNTVEYNIPASSKLGEEIAGSHVGIAIHTYYKEQGAGKEPLGRVNLNSVPGLLLIEPISPKENVKPTDSSLVKQLKSLVSSSGIAINTLFNPAELRQLQISDLPRLCVDYINSLVKDDSVADFDPATLLPGFGKWLQTKVTPRKYNNIVEYLQSPRSNMDGMSAAFTAFVLLHNIKMDMLQQLDRQHPGQEGWVIAHPGGITKFVNRFGFSRANAAQNAPQS
jgi:hypothetical protein